METFKKLVDAFPDWLEEDVVKIAMTRGKYEILNIIHPKSQVMTEKAKLAEKSAMFVPKTVEFTYNEKLAKVKPFLSESEVTFKSLLNTLHIPEIHVGPFDKKPKKAKDDKNECWQICPEGCQQKLICSRFREVYELVKIIMHRLEREHPVYSGLELREGFNKKNH